MPRRYGDLTPFNEDVIVVLQLKDLPVCSTDIRSGAAPSVEHGQISRRRER